MDIHVQHLALLCQICGHENEDHKCKINTNRFVWNSLIWKDLMLLGSPNVHPPLKNNQRNKANLNCNNVFRYSLNMHWLSGIKLKHCRYYSKQRKHEMREVNTKQHKNNKKEKLINLNYFLFLLWWLVLWFLSCRKLIGSTNPVLYDLNKFSHSLYGYFYAGPVCFCQKSCKPCQWSHDLCDRSGIKKKPNDSLQWLMLLFSYMKCFLWNIKCET